MLLLGGRGSVVSPRPPISPFPSPLSPASSVASSFALASDWRGFVEAHRGSAADPQTAYYVSQALEQCSELRAPSVTSEHDWIELAAADALAQPCRGFDGQSINPGEIVALLGAAARAGEPHAAARLLLFRDIAAPKDEVLHEIPRLLATRDPAVVRDVGAFLSKGETRWRFGGEDVPVPAAALAWELAACDLGLACGPASRLALAQCAFEGRCEAGDYEDGVVRHEPPERVALAQRVRRGIVRAVYARDWGWLGLE